MLSAMDEKVAPARAGAAAAASASLVPIAGPPLRAIELKAGGSSATSGITVGRHEQCDVRLPSDAVSRRHALLRCDGAGRWRLIDLKSRWGTFLNGCRISPDTDIPLQPGDLIRISPWTFNFSAAVAGAAARGRNAPGVESFDDVDRMRTLVRSVTSHGTGQGLAENQLAILLESAAALHAATDERSLAEGLIESACRGSGLPNAAVLRPVDAHAGRVDVIAARHGGGGGGGGHSPVPMTYSRSLLKAASEGSVAEFAPTQDHDVAHSIVLMKIDAALCVPLMLGATVAAYLYLDTRGGGHAPISAHRWNATCAFCLALGRIASLALANLKRIDMERRAAQAEAELRAAAEAQRWVLPQRHVTVGPFRCVGESRPGRHVGGDFFDLIPLEDGRLAVALGDVAGKGIPASILMTTAQGFLHAALLQHARPDAAVTQLNRFLSPRLPTGRFLTLWVGIFDPGGRRLQYVDAGHGYAFLLGPAGGSFRRLDEGENLPVGVAEAFDYRCVDVALDDESAARVLIVSDGIVEQPAAVESATGDDAFGIEGIRTRTGQLISAADPVAELFAAVGAHAGGGSSLADDATALWIQW